MSDSTIPEADAAETKFRAEWLHKHKAHKDWIILSVSEVAVIRDELLAVKRELDELKALLTKEQGAVTISRNGYVQELERERDEAREDATHWKAQCQKGFNIAELIRERDEARAEMIRWMSIAEGRGRTDDDDTGKAMAKLIRQRDEAREAAAKWESSFDAMERAGADQARRADENREWALKAERERDEAREQRDRLAEALQSLRDCIQDTRGKDAYEAVIKADEALQSLTPNEP